MNGRFISKMAAGAVVITTLFSLVPLRASAEWEKDYQGNWYYMQDNQKMTGWKRIDGQLYYFDSNGKMQTGWIKAAGSWYFLKSNGAMKTGWIKYNGNTYYTDSSGVMQTGTINISGKIYIFDDNGIMKNSNTIIDGQFYTIGIDGEVVGVATPTPSKEFDDYGNCITVLKNTDSNTNSKESTSASPTYSKFNDVIEDQSDSSEEDSDYGIEYTLVYRDSNGDKLKSKTVKKDKSVDLYEPTKTGNNFVEWNTKSDGSGKSYSSDDSVKVNKDITLYAQWKADTTVYVTSISVTGSSNVVIGETAQMTATISPTDAANSNVTWSVTSGTGSATIDSNGLLTGVTAGTVTVKATAKDGSGISGTKEVTVSTTDVVVAVTSISVTSTASTITTSGGTLKMSATVKPTNASNQNVTWSVENNTGSATISDAGLLTAVSNGTVTVKATAKDSSGVVGSKTITISGQSTKILVESITVSGANSSTTITTNGGTLQMSAAVLPSSATNSAITWSVEDGTGSATINSSGLLTALNNGTVTVKATAKDGSKVSGTKEITLSNQTSKATEITVTGENDADTITTASGTLQMNAEVLPEDTVDKGVTWSVEQAGVSGTAMTGKATISSSGLLTAESNGTVKVIATSTNGTGVYGSKVITISGQPTKVTAITITTDGNVTELATAGGTNLTLQMYATVTPTNATNKDVTWSITNETGKATISDTGLLTAELNGTVLVTATANDGSGVSRNKLITISGQIVKVTGITVTGASDYETITDDKGTLQMYATISPATATNQTVTWSIEQAGDTGTTMTGKASIDTGGLLTASANGTVKVIATSTDGTAITGEKEITISGQITKVTGITVSSDTNTVAIKGTMQMNATVTPSYASNSAVTWSVSNPDGTTNLYATISSNGILTGVSKGTVVVTATAKDGSGITGTSTTIFIE